MKPKEISEHILYPPWRHTEGKTARWSMEPALNPFEVRLIPLTLGAQEYLVIVQNFKQLLVQRCVGCGFAGV